MQSNALYLHLCFPECLSSLPTVKIAKGPVEGFLPKSTSDGKYRPVPNAGVAQIHPLLYCYKSMLEKEITYCHCKFVKPMKNNTHQAGRAIYNPILKAGIPMITKVTLKNYQQAYMSSSFFCFSPL